MIIPATSEVVSETSHSAVKRLDRRKTRTSPMPRPTQAAVGGERERLAALDDAAAYRQAGPSEEEHEHDGEEGHQLRACRWREPPGHHDWSATSTMPDWNMPMRKPPTTASGIEVRLPTRAAPRAGIT